MIRLGIAIILAATLHAQSWYNTSYGYRKAIAIDHRRVPASLTDFDFHYFDDVDPDLVGHVQASGADITFKAADGVTALDFKLTYDGNTNKLYARIRIQALSSSTDTVIWMYFGNPSAGSEANPAGVWNKFRG